MYNVALPGDSIQRERARPVVLVVDDDPAVLVLLRRILDDHYTALTAADGREATVLCRERPEIGAMLVDVMMPGMSGPEVVTRCRQYLPDVPYVYMSGYSDEVLHQHGVESGAALLRKPFSPQDLLDALDRALSK